MVSARWMYELRQDKMKVISQSRARLVDKGFSQMTGIDFAKLFSNISKCTTIRLMYAIALKYQAISK